MVTEADGSEVLTLIDGDWCPVRVLERRPYEEAWRSQCFRYRIEHEGRARWVEGWEVRKSRDSDLADRPTESSARPPKPGTNTDTK